MYLPRRQYPVDFETIPIDYQNFLYECKKELINKNLYFYVRCNKYCYSTTDGRVRLNFFLNKSSQRICTKILLEIRVTNHSLNIARSFFLLKLYSLEFKPIILQVQRSGEDRMKAVQDHLWHFLGEVFYGSRHQQFNSI